MMKITSVMGQVFFSPVLPLTLVSAGNTFNSRLTMNRVIVSRQFDER